ncbi:Sec-independent protein translocase subunit TatA [Nocardia arizonensis]|uniref:Sec-independent protein translocase subunit TatA n=1 Tax=Nocardia arizonensis TaxID=1141647 RepID=UPI0009EB9BA4|nr:Sec-independent protein translocase subunit TatA [Nocardia arizonensis]
MGTLSVTHWLIILGVVVILFGAKRMPDAARGLGRSMRIFKSEIREMHGEDAPAAAAPAPAPSATRAVRDPLSETRAADPAPRQNHSVPSGT